MTTKNAPRTPQFRPLRVTKRVTELRPRGPCTAGTVALRTGSWHTRRGGARRHTATRHTALQILVTHLLHVAPCASQWYMAAVRRVTCGRRHVVQCRITASVVDPRSRRSSLYAPVGGRRARPGAGPRARSRR